MLSCGHRMSGSLLTAFYFTVGFTLSHILTPSFSYRPSAVNCSFSKNTAVVKVWSLHCSLYLPSNVRLLHQPTCFQNGHILYGVPRCLTSNQPDGGLSKRSCGVIYIERLCICFRLSALNACICELTRPIWSCLRKNILSDALWDYSTIWKSA